MAGNKQGGKGKKSKKDKPTRIRYRLKGQDVLNKKRRVAKHGPPGHGEVWRNVKAKRQAKRAMRGKAKK